MATALPFSIDYELVGWELFWALLEVEREAPEELAALRREVAEEARRRFASAADLASHPTVAALRRLFRDAGCDPTRYRPASEALLRRLLKGEALPAIHPLVDVNNGLSAQLAVPCCVMADGSFGGALRWRAGRPGESYESLRGPFNLEGKPLLLDAEGPLDTPITGGRRVKVLPATRRAWLVAYLPAGVVSADEAWDRLEELSRRAGVVARRYM
jgi:DNA/RNA-binding domain of Phe-tRNA-synthetase-like protein